jgi:hypothetical protein
MQPVGWWMVMVIFMIGKMNGGACVMLHNSYIHKRCNAQYKVKGSGRTFFVEKKKWIRQIETYKNIKYIFDQVAIINRSVAYKIALRLIVIFTFDFLPYKIKKNILVIKKILLG